MAISIVKKPPAPAGGNKSSMLKNTLKKSMSVPTSVNKPLQPVPKSSATSFKAGPSSAVVSHAVGKKASTSGQRQFEYAEQIKKHKEEMIQKINKEKETQLNFKFTANPAPKFKKVAVVTKQVSVDHKKLVKQNSMPQLSTMSKKFTSKDNIVPSCGDPERLKLMEEKKKKILAKYLEAPVQFKAKPAAVLKKQPFQPVHNISKIIDTKPFKLHLSDRLHLRSEFDRKLQETIAIRQKQQQIRQQLADFEDRRVQRQKTIFRANPIPSRNNPARNNH